MSASWKIASMVVLPLSLALVGTGCMAQAADDESTEDSASVDQVAEQQAPATDEEQTGEATQAFGCGGCGPCSPFLGGFARGFGGCSPFIGRFNGCAFGGFGCGPFAGCCGGCF